MSASPDPVATLAEVERVRTRTRLDLQSCWYPMVAVGAASLGLAAVTELAPRWAGLYWLAAFATCFVATGRFYRARAIRLGVETDGRIYLVFWLLFFLAPVIAGSIAERVGGSAAGIATVCAVLGVLYLGIARLQSSIALAAIGLGTIALGIVLAAAEPRHGGAIADLCLGGALVVGGLYEFSRDSGP
jgi:hypothetical protein